MNVKNWKRRALDPFLNSHHNPNIRLIKWPIITLFLGVMFPSALVSIAVYTRPDDPIIADSLRVLLVLPASLSIVLMAMQLLFVSVVQGQERTVASFFMVVVFSFLTCVLGFSVLYYVIENTIVVECLSVATAEFDYIYFSATTFTTVGYGDIVPVGRCRLLATVQMIAGYVWLAAAVALLSIAMQNLYVRARSRYLDDWERIQS